MLRILVEMIIQNFQRNFQYQYIDYLPLVIFKAQLVKVGHYAVLCSDVCMSLGHDLWTD